MPRRSFLIALATLGLVATAARAQASDTCKKDAKFREQDFTIGNWDVYSGTEKTAEVAMTPILNDCVIEERWKVTNGRPTGNGVGLFNYSPLLKNWGYYWATDNGGTTSFRGQLIKPGEMRYVTEKPLPDGKTRLRHWTLYAMPDGTIRELAIGTEDGGTSWTTEYDLKWVRRK